jgi:dolichyl-phosphate beta-glucosyltransferase
VPSPIVRGCDVTLILPAYNEAARIRSTVEQAFQYFDRRGMQAEIIVAADGTDGSREIVREMARMRERLVVFGNEGRCGKGRGIRQAVAMATGAIIGFADADNKVPIEEYDKIERALASGHQVVIGSRAVSGSRVERHQPLHRELGGKAFGVFMRAITGLPVQDTQCGFKFFPSPIARDLFSRQTIDGYMFDVEILFIARRLGYSILEVPVRWRDDGDSRLDIVSGNLTNLRDILMIRRRHANLSGGLDQGYKSTAESEVAEAAPSREAR